MEKTGFDYEITISAKFTQEEFDLLCEAFNASSEYKRYIDAGEHSFMNANKHYFSDGTSLLFTNREIDISLKVIELHSFGRLPNWGKKEAYSALYDGMFDLHKQIEKEYKRITNPE